MSDLQPGLERSDEFEVGGALLTDVGGTIGISVLSTPGMIACVKHVAAAGEGAQCTVHARLREVADGRKLRFDVEVREGDRTIGVGTHERRVIEVG